MQENEYRGKRKDTGAWVFGYYFADWRYDDNGHHYIRLTDSSMETRVIPETVGQYTGLLDRNGVRIFVGDILKSTEFNVRGIVHWGLWEAFKDKGFYCWLAGEYAIGCITGTNSAEYWEVIGNSYDHKTLLENK